MALLDSFLVADLINLSAFSRVWGIFSESGLPVIVADNVVSLEFKKDWNVSDYPLERGAFESYNKVQTPYDARIMFTTGGSLVARRAFLASIHAIAGNLKLYSVVTPEATYPKANIVHFDYSRSDGKAGLLKVEIWLREIRNDAQAALGYDDAGSNETVGGGGADATAGGNTGAPAVTAAANPASTSSVSTGQVQSVDPTEFSGNTVPPSDLLAF